MREEQEGKLLIVSWVVHPWPSGSSVIVNNIASQFRQDELVLFGEEYLNDTDLSWPSNYPKIHYTNPNINIRGRGQRYLRWVNIRKVINEIIEVVERENVNKILCIFPDEFYLFAAYTVSKRLNLPMFSWFHNTFADNLMGLRKYFAMWMQPRVFRHCKVNFVMSEGMKLFYGKKYPKTSFHTLPHGFELPQPKKALKNEEVRTQNKFVYTGNLNESCRDASIRLLKVILDDPNNVVDAYCSTTPEEFQGWGIDSKNFHVKGFVSLDELNEKLRTYDILLLPHGFDGGRTQVEFDTIFPTRTIPLLTAGKPILAHSPKGSFLTHFLKQNKCALNVDTKDVSMIKSAISKLLEDKEYVEELTKNAFLTSKYFEIENVVSILRESLNLK